MAWLKQIRGPYLCYTVEREFLTSHLLEQKPLLMQDFQNPEHDIALDISKLQRIDSLALRFLVNADELLEQKGHSVVLVGGDLEIVAQFKKSRAFVHYNSMADFEREFHDLNPELLKSILQLSEGGSGFRMLQLQCPICHFDEVTGFVLDESKYRLTWTASDVIPVWVGVTDDAEPIDFWAYRVAVCPSCFFAATRPDHFTIHFPEGEIKSILKPEQITALAIGAGARKALAAESPRPITDTFFNPPREANVAYLSWKLLETCQKQISPDRHFVDAFEIVQANFMMCKYASSERLIDDHLHTALAWLNNLMQNQSRYSTQRLIQAHTYFVSVLLGLNKVPEARRALADFSTHFANEPELPFWLQRADALVNESRE